MATVLDFPAGAPTFDWSDGGIWYATQTSLVHLAPDGQSRTVITESQPLPGSETTLALDPGQETGWALVAGFALERLNLDPGSFSITPVLQQNSAGLIATARDGNENFQMAGPILLGAAPLPGSTPYLWTGTEQVLVPGTAQLAAVAVAVDGTITQAATVNVPQFLPGANPGGTAMTTLGAARSLQSNALCLATLETVAPYTVQLFWITTGGGAVLLDQTDVPWNTLAGGNQNNPVAVTASQLRGSDVCWIGYEQTVPQMGGGNLQQDLQGFLAPDGTLVADFLLPPEIMVAAFRAIGIDDLWIAGNTQQPSETQNLPLVPATIHFEAVSGGRYQQLESVSVVRLGRKLSPESRARTLLVSSPRW